MKKKFLWLALPLLAALVLVIFINRPCNQSKFGQSGCALRNCINKNQYKVLVELSDAFEVFMQDNGYLNDTGSRSMGYKAYLNAILTMHGPDTNWVYRRDALEKMLQRIEKQRIAELLFSNTLAGCVIRIPYPDGHIMADIRQIMPQHTVSPARFAEEFIRRGDDAQLEDPVLRIMLAVEYFLGPVLGQLRPEEPGCDHHHHH